MKITIRTEADRQREAIAFAQRQIAEYNRRIEEYNYSEDVNGNPVYTPWAYSEEKQECVEAKREWAFLLKLLTEQAPFTAYE